MVVTVAGPFHPEGFRYLWGRGELAMTKKHDTAQDGFNEAVQRHAYKLLGASVALLLVIGTVAYRALEDWSWVDSLYFSAVAVTTVGFGDLTPSTDASKLFTVAYVLSGIGIITTFVNLKLQLRAERMGEKRRAKS